MTDAQFNKIKSQIQFGPGDLVPAIIQDEKSKKVLTLCYLNEQALRATLEKKMIVVFRRSQQKLMMKGERSGHTQGVKDFRIDCEGKSLLFLVDPKVAGCHKGYFSCYFESVDDEGGRKTNEPRVFDPEKVYR